MSATVVTSVMGETMVVYHSALTAAVANIRMTTDVVHPMLTALETTCVSILMYSKVADRILEHSDLKYCAFLL